MKNANMNMKPAAPGEEHGRRDRSGVRNAHSGRSAATKTAVPRVHRARLKPGERRVQILQTLAAMLAMPEEKITTAALAVGVGVSEAALYRQFASKAQMFEALIDFIEQTLFARISQMIAEEPNGVLQVRAIALMLLQFAEKNAGMTRVLTGEALVGEHKRLTARVNQIIDRIETTLLQCLRTEGMETGAKTKTGASVGDSVILLPENCNPIVRASLVICYVTGCWRRYTQSGFKRKPGEYADALLRVMLQ